MVNGRPVFRTATFAEIVPLRHAVLRAGMPRSAAIFAGDDDPTSLHFAAANGDHVVCCLTYHRSTWDGIAAWQLRGMATHPDHRGRGVGRQLLLLAEQTLITTSPIRLLWCNARVGAIGFYRNVGWRIASNLFTIPTAGPHFRMVKVL